MRGSLTKWLVLGVGALLLLSLPQASLAQGAQGEEEEHDEYDYDRFAFGIGAGLVQPDNSGLGGDGDGEIYYSANLRWLVRGRDRGAGRRYSDDPNKRHYRGRWPGNQGIRGYLEAEVGYWERSEIDDTFEDLLLGLNLLGVVPTPPADIFFGAGFGLHFTDGDRIFRGASGAVTGRQDLNDERLGGNVQVGVDINLSDKMAIFALGRLDILEDGPFDRQTKVWGGLRFHF